MNRRRSWQAGSQRLADDRHLGVRRLRGESLQSAEPLARQRADHDRDLGCSRGNLVVLPGVEAHDSRGLGSAEAPGKRCPEGDGYLAEDGARKPPPDVLLPALHPLGDLNLPGNHREERPLLALVHRVLAGAQMDIGGGLRDPLAVGVNEAGEQRDRGDVVGRQHGVT